MKLIDKSALVAEIEKLKEKYGICPVRSEYEEGLKDGRLIGYKDAIDKINHLEVKEVESMQEDPCDGCINRKGCVTCENGELRETVQEEPVSVWHDSNKEQPNFASAVAIWNPKYENGEILSRCTEVYSDRIWAYIDDLLKM